MVLSSGAATKNVCGGRLRSTMRGSLAQLASNARAAPAIARRARDQKYLRKGILRSLRGVRDVALDPVQSRSTRDRSDASSGQVAVLDAVQRSEGAGREAGEDSPVAVL